MSIIGKRIEYKYEHHPKTMEAVVVDKVNVSKRGDYNSDRMEYSGSLQITKYLVQRLDTNTTLLITPDMVKKILD